MSRVPSVDLTGYYYRRWPGQLVNPVGPCFPATRVGESARFSALTRADPAVLGLSEPDEEGDGRSALRRPPHRLLRPLCHMAFLEPAPGRPVEFVRGVLRTVPQLSLA